MSPKKTKTFTERLRQRTRGIILVRAFKTFLFSWLALGLVLYLMLFLSYVSPAFSFFHMSGLIFLGVLFGLPSFLTLLVIVFQRQDMHKLTMTLEEHYPHLRDRLVTVVELSENNAQIANNPFSQALAKNLEEEMNSLMDRFGFGRASALNTIILPACLIGLFLMTGAVHAFLDKSFFLMSYQRLTGASSFQNMEANHEFFTEPLPQFEMKVIPGDCEVAKGSNFLIQVQVKGYDPKKVVLYMRKEDELAWRVFPMKAMGDGQYEYMIRYITEPSLYFVKADYKESDKFQIKLFDALMIKKAIWRMEFPKYMKLPNETREGWGEKLTVPQGTTLHLNLNMSRPVNPGRIFIGEDKEIKLEQTAPDQLEASVVVANDVVLRMEVSTPEGEPLLGLSSLWIQTIPDLAPYVEVLEPQIQNYVYRTQEIPFEINVDDDYGIESVTVVLRYQGKEKRIEWLQNGARPDEVNLKRILEFEQFDLETRDLVFAYLEVKDNYPGEPAHIVKSSLFAFLIRDYVEQFRMNSPPPELPSLRSLFEDVLIDQEKIIQDSWDYLSMMSDVSSIAWIQQGDPSEKGAPAKS